MSEHSEKKTRVITGRVVSNKMQKSITVLIERLEPHPVYGKYVRRSTRVIAHDEDNICHEGDLVSLTSCRPISKRKTWRLVEVLKSAQE
ncbi:MAG: 30S ribosomal protein S17 [Gammaproteobacteria bacterium]